jgi:hypothetical protein
MQSRWVTTSFNAVGVYLLRIVESGSTLTTEMDPPLPFPVSIAPSLGESIEAVGATLPSVRCPPPPAPPKCQPTYVVALAPTWLFCFGGTRESTRIDQFVVTFNSTL